MSIVRDEFYIKRSIEPVLLAAAREFPAVTLTGPRQSGKTTLLRRHFSSSHRYVSFESPEVRAAAETDPRGFLAQHPAPVIFDEIQHAPGLLPCIKEAIDERRPEHGRYLLTRSAIGAATAESLAGRTAMLRLLPLSRREARGQPDAPLPWERAEAAAPVGGTGGLAPHLHDLWSDIVRGGYPELTAQPDRSLARWHEAYLQTWLERDVRGLRAVGDLNLFQAFLRALAARSGQLLNVADLARGLGTAPNTVRAWISVLEATCQVRVVRPWPEHLGRRMVKTPKVYFTDTGLLCRLVGLRDPHHAAGGPLGAALFETAVLAELVRTLTHRGQEPSIWFWRTSNGREVDFLVEWDGRLVPIEVRLSATPRPAMGDAIRRLRTDLGERCLPGYVVHLGAQRLPLGEGVTALPLSELCRPGPQNGRGDEAGGRLA